MSDYEPLPEDDFDGFACDDPEGDWIADQEALAGWTSRELGPE